MQFEWDKNKNKTNLQKHGIDFEDAKRVFDDQQNKIIADKRKDYGEKRWKIIGKIYGTLISVIYTVRGFSIRIISARKASHKERKEYNKK